MTTDNPGWAAWRSRFDAALTGYLDCALWSESCRGTAETHHANPDACRGEDCDASLSHDLNLSVDDMAPGAARECEEDLYGFVTSVLAERPGAFDGMSPAQVGHDFWLTRNGHGAGFWDRGLGELGDYLTAMSKPFGGCSLHVGDDGMIYVG